MAASRKTETIRWFRPAFYDLKAARWNIDGGFYSTACFLAQQSGEKVLQSLLYYLGARRKALLTHSIFEMATEAGKHVTGLQNLLHEARQLDIHYIPSRYPNGLPDLTPGQVYFRRDAELCLESSQRLLAAVAEFMGEADKANQDL